MSGPARKFCTFRLEKPTSKYKVLSRELRILSELYQKHILFSAGFGFNIYSLRAGIRNISSKVNIQHIKWTVVLF